MESGEVVLQQGVGVLNAVGVLPDDPDDSGFGFGFVELINLADDSGDDGFVLVGVFAEDVLDDDGGFLDDVGDAGVDELEEGVDALPCSWLDLDGEFTDGADGFADELDIDLGGVFAELVEDDGNVGFGGEHEDEFELGDFDVDGVIVLAEEDSDVVW